MKVPFIDLKAQYRSIKGEVDAAIHEVLDSQQFILGPKVEELERNIAAYCGVKYAVGVSSGTDGLLVSMMALGVKPGDEVITTSFSFFATAGAVARLGAIPVFVDIDPDTYNIDPRKIEPAISKRTKGIIPVHLFGQCADMAPILQTGRKHKLWVVEDAAQSLGAEYPMGTVPAGDCPRCAGKMAVRARKAGSMGDLGIFSFFPTKNLGGFGDGGMVVTNDKSLYEKIKLLRVHGASQKYHHRIVGGNFRLDAIQAAILNVKLKYLDRWSQKRRQNAEFYNRRFEESGLVVPAKGLTQPKSSSPLTGEDKGGGEGFISPPVADYRNSGLKNYHIYNQYTICAKNRDKLRDSLKKNGIGTEIYYPSPLHLQECFKKLSYKKGSLPVSEEISRSVLSLPIYPELSTKQMDYIITKISAFYAKRQ